MEQYQHKGGTMNLIAFIASPSATERCQSVCTSPTEDIARHFQVPKEISQCNTEYGANLMSLLND